MTLYYHRSEPFSGFFSVIISLSKVLYLVLSISVAFITVSCEEEPTLIGKDILPGNDFVTVGSVDTFNIFSYTKYDYPVRSENPETVFLGSFWDPYFGTTTNEFVSQVRMESEWVDEPYVVDSVKLALRVITLKKSSDMPRSLKITEIARQLYSDSAYYSNTIVDTTDFGISVELPALKSDTINNIEISLPPSFGEYLIRKPDSLFYSNTVPDFRSYFKGLYFRIPASTTEDNLFLGLELNLALSLGIYTDYIVLYMHNNEDITQKYIFRFILDPIKKNACFNLYKHDFSTATSDVDIGTIINTEVKDTLSYLQSLNGVYTKLIFPGLEDIKNGDVEGKIAINKAKLYVPVHFDGNQYTPSTVPSNLRLRYLTTTGEKDDIPDYYLNKSYFGGKLDSINDIYQFNISAFIQQYLDDETGKLKPELEVFQSSTGIKNVIFKANDSKSPVKLELTLTQF